MIDVDRHRRHAARPRSAAITGVAPTINASTGAITLHTGTAQNLDHHERVAPAFAALGFASPVTAARGGGGTAGTGVVIGNDLTTFTNESISGGAVTAYNAAGTPVNLQLRWAKTDSAALGAGHQDTWNLFYQTRPTATGTQAAWVNAGTNFTFGANGSLASPTGSSISIPNVTVDGQSLGTLSFNIASGALTQFASTERRRDHQHHLAERLRRRPAAVGRRQQQRPRGRHLLQRPEPRSRRGHAVALQRHQLPEGARRRRLCGDRSVGPGDRRRLRARSAARRWKARTPTSPTNSPS